jgi:hypothetical protein
LAPRADLLTQAGQFAKELSDLLNHTVTDGVRLKSLLRPDGRSGWVGFGITQARPFLGEAIPIGWRGARPRCWLYVAYTLHQDPGRYLTVTKSTYALRVSADSSGPPLFHYDFNRDPTSVYPEAHVQVPGQSWVLGQLGDRFGRQWELGQLHFPVGDRRFRPCLEDVVEFLIVEGFAEPRDSGWRDVLEEHREGFYRRQLGAAVRHDPETARQALADADAETKERARQEKSKRPRFRRQ